MAQSMANGNTQPRQLDPQIVHENTTYADEGDEVMYHRLYTIFTSLKHAKLVHAMKFIWLTLFWGKCFSKIQYGIQISLGSPICL